MAANWPARYGIVGGEQLNRDRGVLQPAQRVHAWADLKADGFAVDLAGYDAGHIHQGQQADALRVSQLIESPLQQVAGVIDLFGHIGHDTQCNQVEQGFFIATAAGQCVEFLHQLVGNAYAWQRAQRIVVGLELGVDDGIGTANAILAGALLVQAPEWINTGRQRLKLRRQIMMIGDHHGQSKILGNPDGRPFIDAGVAGEQHVDGDGRGFQGLGQLFGQNAMALSKPIGDVIVDSFRPGQGSQGSHQQRCAGLAVHIKVAPDQNIPTLLDRVVEQSRGFGDAEQACRFRRRVCVRIEEGVGLFGCLVAALGKQARNQRVAADEVDQLCRRFNLWDKAPGLVDGCAHQKANSGISSKENSSSMARSATKSASASATSSSSPASLPRLQRLR